MNDEWSAEPSAAPDESDTDVFSLLKSMQQQLLLMEKKIDRLISHSQERPSGEKSSDRTFRKKPFSKPFRSFEHPQRHGRGEYGHGNRERDSAQGHFYEHRPSKKGRGPGPGKKPSFKRKDNE
jgi:hypothetical protein